MIATTAHSFWYVAVILIQQVLILGLLWTVLYLADRPRRERRRHGANVPLKGAAATDDLAAMAVQLARSPARAEDPVPGRSGVQAVQEQRDTWSRP